MSFIKKDGSVISTEEAIKIKAKMEDKKLAEIEEKYPVEWVEVKGYKAVSKNLKSFHGNYTYKINKPNIYEGDLELCKSGLHFCPKLEDIFLYVNILEARIFEVSAIIDKNYIKRRIEKNKYFSHFNIDDKKMVAKSITFIRELSTEEIYNVFEDYLTSEAFFCKINSINDFSKARFRFKKFFNKVKYETKRKLLNCGYSEISADSLVKNIYSKTIEKNNKTIRICYFNKRLLDLAIKYAKERHFN